MSTWINFKELRAKLPFEQVLRHYGVEVKIRGNQHHGFCPLPNHNGKRNSPSFSANLARGIFQCFGCGAKGNVLEFAALMENMDASNGTEFRALAIRLQKQFCPELVQVPGARQRSPEVKQPPKRPSPTEAPVIVNAPLDFELKGLDPSHPYLLSRGFLPETIAHFGLGFCKRGSLKDRVAIALHDHRGRLIGYSGRVVDDAAIGENNPRYRLPSKRNRDGKTFEFRKSRFLYNGFRMNAPLDSLIVVEGFTAVWWLHQQGWPHVVATMGSDCSERQTELLVELVKPAGHIWIIPDGNAAGERLAESLLVQLSPHRFVRWVKLPEDMQPTDLSAEQLKASFTL